MMRKEPEFEENEDRRAVVSGPGVLRTKNEGKRGSGTVPEVSK